MEHDKRGQADLGEAALPESCASCSAYPTTEWACLSALAGDILKSSRRLTTYRIGETLFHQHGAPQGIYCLMKGLVILKRFDVFGNETAFRLLFPGETCGWRSLFAEEEHVASAVVLEASTVCLVPRAEIERMMKVDPGLARQFLRTMARDPGPADAILLRNNFLPARVRLAHLLLILADRCAANPGQGRLSFRLPIKRKHIAALIGVGSETVSRAIKELEDESLARFDKRDLIIPDVAALRRAVS